MAPSAAAMTAPVNVFAGSPLDRAGNLRRDAGWLASRLVAPETRFVPLWRLHPLVGGGEAPSIAWQSREAMRPFVEGGAPWVLLGLEGDVAHFAVDISRLEAPEDSAPFAGAGTFAELRAAAASLPAGDAAILAQARSLIDWHARHGFCAVCGSPTVAQEGGSMRVCSREPCAAQHFPRTDPVVITIVVHDDHCLLGRNARFPGGFYSALAGFIEQGETIEEAVRREVGEEAGVAVGAVRYHSSQPWPFPSSLMIGCIAEAAATTIKIDKHELDDARWFHRDAVRKALAGEDEASGLRMPPPLAIAHQLARWWVETS